MPSLLEPPTEEETSDAVCADPHVIELAAAFARSGFGRGPEHERFGEDLACLLVELDSRNYGSRLKAAKKNRVPAVWNRKRDIIRDSTGRDLLPPAPPSAEVVRKWRNRFLPDDPRRREEHRPRDSDGNRLVPQQLTEVLDVAMDLAVERAREFGHFTPGVDPDFARPDTRHMVVADGTYIAPYSNASVWTDPDTGTEYTLRSRAKDPGNVRVQEVIHSYKKDTGQRVIGVNHVVVLTRTPYGRLFLGVDRALGGENVAALDVLERLVTRLGDGLHAVGYDKALTGWTRTWLMAAHGVAVISTAIAENREADIVTSTKLDVVAALKASGHVNNNTIGRDSDLTFAVAQSRLNQLAEQTAATERPAGDATGHGLPLGRCQYLDSKGNVAFIDSEYARYGDHTHPLPDGNGCTHRLYVDDGALWEVITDGAHDVKNQRPVCREARRRPAPDAASFQQRASWELRCAVTGELLTFETVWRPEYIRNKLKTSQRNKRTQQDIALTLMQVLARCDTGFGDIYGLRNDTESWFSWYKDTLLRGERAASLNIDRQLLDVLYGGIITNALALRNFRRMR